MYHLHLTEAPSNHGFYHWRTDVARLIATHWSNIFGPTVKKKKTWQVSPFFFPLCCLLNPPLYQGSVSGSLSGNASTLFESGLSTIGDQGWWRLRSLDPPALQLSRLAPKVVVRCVLTIQNQMNENQIMQQAIKTNRGSARSAEQEKRKGKLQVELSLKVFCFFN